MNYLAHLYLSNNDPQILIGNFIADHVKGSAVDTYTGGIREGIRIHRFIDAFTDAHPVVATSKERLRPEFRKYAPVIVDVFYDHFLARDWEQYHGSTLSDFASESYKLLYENAALIPDRALHMLRYMEAQNWLLSYAGMEGMQRALTGLSRRTTFESNMQNAHLFLEKHYVAFEEEFQVFFPELRSYVSRLSDTGN